MELYVRACVHSSVSVDLMADVWGGRVELEQGEEGGGFVTGPCREAAEVCQEEINRSGFLPSSFF